MENSSRMCVSVLTGLYVLVCARDPVCMCECMTSSLGDASLKFDGLRQYNSCLNRSVIRSRGQCTLWIPSVRLRSAAIVWYFSALFARDVFVPSVRSGVGMQRQVFSWSMFSTSAIHLPKKSDMPVRCMIKLVGYLHVHCARLCCHVPNVVLPFRCILAFVCPAKVMAGVIISASEKIRKKKNK